MFCFLFLCLWDGYVPVDEAGCFKIRFEQSYALPRKIDSDSVHDKTVAKDASVRIHYRTRHIFLEGLEVSSYELACKLYWLMQYAFQCIAEDAMIMHLARVRKS